VEGAGARRYTGRVQRPHLASQSIPEPVRELCDRLADAGFRAWVVGGCIRDLLMGKEVSDWDLATDATPDEVRRVFKRTVPTGIAHGTMTVLHRGGHYEVTTLRGEGAYSDGRRPDSVHFVSDIDEDLARRDFTVNAIAYDPRADAIVDPWGGVEDLAHRVVRAVRDPLEFELDPDTEAAIPPTLPTFRKVSPERVRDEWDKTLTRARRPSRALEVMRRTGMLAITAPSIHAMADDAFARTMRRADAAAKELPIRVAALLLEAEGDHDAWMRALRFSNEERETTLHLLRARQHIAGAESWTDAGVRDFLRHATRAHWPRVVALEHADRVARGLSIEPVEALDAAIDRALAANAPLVTGDLAISGKDVMQALGSGPGRHVGVVLARLLDRAVEDPSINERARLLAMVPDIAKEIGA
jgi:tRNA nucleotidyltransferase (CCA-adding enzyme)